MCFRCTKRISASVFERKRNMAKRCSSTNTENVTRPQKRFRPCGIPPGVILNVDCQQLKDQPTETLWCEQNVANTTSLLDEFCVDPEWHSLLRVEFEKPYVRHIFEQYRQRVNNGEEIFPIKKDIFAWTRFCPPEKVRVVILGQDPYHGPGQAHGLAFSVTRGTPIPPSLKNIFLAVRESYPHLPLPTHGCLDNWARQGVLLLNTTLTVKRGVPGSHFYMGWDMLIKSMLKTLCLQRTGLVFMLWGVNAQRTIQPNPSEHLVLTYGHPSPLSRSEFRVCKHFLQANNYFLKRGEPIINWTI
ncbi:uracil DNA glycosylase [Cercopithecine alphaherpesvirus 9]|uniref:Uracil DNA glycosylase n=2 Tax=Cercopithecine alphaherpesvirus 9 TaxID=35246 RepID=A0A2D0TCL0_CHV9D|nr:uracil DNA glycosylase [Cercopithecine alphaherpesvirus 9]AAD41748.1 uracil DNA glycosylase [Cercopithecine alphaherpesvirus 9]AAG27234.1 uracil DNA glycosylase [Cercopithecine alphaherpesvirus 9]